MIGTLLGCRARAGVDQTNAELPKTMMKSRRLMVFPLPRIRLGAGKCITFYNEAQALHRGTIGCRHT